MSTQRRTILAACLALASPFVASQGVGPASDTELKAVYCLAADKITLARLEGARDGMATGGRDVGPSIDYQIADLSADISRLKAYVLPKQRYLDTTALSSASDRGESDAIKAGQDLDQCASWATPDGEKGACVARSEAAKRIKSCDRAHFLPF